MFRLDAMTPDDTQRFGERLGRLLTARSVICLTGDLGLGKTTFTKGLGKGLNIPGSIQSPTYGLVHFHEGGRLPLWHADLYRIESEADLEQLGLDEAMSEAGVVVVEWGERFPSCFTEDHLQVTLSEHECGRVIELRATGPRHMAMVSTLHD